MSDQFHFFRSLTAEDAHELAEWLLGSFRAADDPDPTGSIVYVTGDTAGELHDFEPGTEVRVEATDEDDYLGDGLYYCVSTADESQDYWVGAADLDVDPPRLPVGTRVRIIEAPYMTVPDDFEDTGIVGVINSHAPFNRFGVCYAVDLEGKGHTTVYASKVEQVDEAEPPRRNFQVGDTVTVFGQVGVIVAEVPELGGTGSFEVVRVGNPMPDGCAKFPGAGTWPASVIKPHTPAPF